ncbi:MAG: hypothetical protein AAF942_06490 [Pseudomonadota bacterium]
MKKSIILSVTIGLLATSPAFGDDAKMQQRVRECGSLVTSLGVLKYAADRSAKEANAALASYNRAKTDADKAKYQTLRGQKKSTYLKARGRINGLKGRYTRSPSCESVGKKVRFSSFTNYTKAK